MKEIYMEIFWTAVLATIGVVAAIFGIFLVYAFIVLLIAIYSELWRN